MAEDEPQDEQAPEPEPAAEGAGEAPPPPPGPPPGAAGGPKPEVGAYISKGWEIVKADPVLFILGYLVLATIAGFTMGLLAGPVMFGFFRVAQKRLKGEAAEFGDLFSGFKEFGRSFVTGLLVFAVCFAVAIVLIVIMIILSFIPCIGQVLSMLLYIAAWLFLGPALFFVFPIAALSETQPVDCLKQSFAFFKANLWPMVLLSLVLGLVASLGSVACCIGIYVTTPIAMVAMVVAYNEYYLPNAPQAG